MFISKGNCGKFQISKPEALSLKHFVLCVAKPSNKS